jgi:LPS export ABC transporter permease LptF
MGRPLKLIDLYIIRAITPFIFLSLVLLTSVLLIQQANRYAELLFLTGMPVMLAPTVLVNLLPVVLVFTVPMAVMTGILIGFSRMGADSELIAMRASGVGNWNILRPALLIGTLLSIVMVYVGMSLAPRATHGIRRVALKATLKKLESPVEPKIFNTEIPGNVIYVQEGDNVLGQWGRVFIRANSDEGEERLVTARSGRIDSSAEQSELVLTDVVQTTYKTQKQNSQPHIVERISLLRYRFDTGREKLIQKFREGKIELDEMDWAALRQELSRVKGKDVVKGTIVLHRRLSLALSPLVFAVLAVGLGMRLGRRGKAFGAMTAILAMLGYYLLAMGGEHLYRFEILPAFPAMWIANFAALTAGLFLILSSYRLVSGLNLRESLPRLSWKKSSEIKETKIKSSFPALIDRTVFRSLTATYISAFTALVVAFYVFTLFDLWRSMGGSNESGRVILAYLFYLFPFTVVSLVAFLATYALLARRSEAIAWWACGQSIYRLAIPGLVFSLAIGLMVWLIQENIMPRANQKQDSLRVLIRSGVSKTSQPLGRQWLASADGSRIYSYEYDELNGKLISPTVFELDSERVHLARLVSGASGMWDEGGNLHLEDATEMDVISGAARKIRSTKLERSDPKDIFKPTSNKPSQLNARMLREYIEIRKKIGIYDTSLVIALLRKYAEPYNSLVMALIGIPLALSFGKKSAVTALISAVAIGIGFWGLSAGFQQLGLFGLLPPVVAAITPLVFFGAIGLYLFARTQT